MPSPKQPFTARSNGQDHEEKKYKPKDIPKGVKGDHKKAFEILNEWAGYLEQFNKDVFAELHKMRKYAASLESRIMKIEEAAGAPTVQADHISPPPPPPYT